MHMNKSSARLTSTKNISSQFSDHFRWSWYFFPWMSTRWHGYMVLNVSSLHFTFGMPINPALFLPWGSGSLTSPLLKAGGHGDAKKTKRDTAELVEWYFYVVDLIDARSLFRCVVVVIQIFGLPWMFSLKGSEMTEVDDQIAQHSRSLRGQEVG